MSGSGRVTIEPEEFKLVEFDRDELTALVEQLLDATGIERSVTLEVDQTTPLGHAEVRSIGDDRIVLHVESGALEDPRKLRKLSPSGAATVLGRLLFRVGDRIDPAFGDPPADGDMSLELQALVEARASAESRSRSAQVSPSPLQSASKLASEASVKPCLVRNWYRRRWRSSKCRNPSRTSRPAA